MVKNVVRQNYSAACSTVLQKKVGNFEVRDILGHSFQQLRWWVIHEHHHPCKVKHLIFVGTLGTHVCLDKNPQLSAHLASLPSLRIITLWVIRAAQSCQCLSTRWLSALGQLWSKKSSKRFKLTSFRSPGKCSDLLSHQGDTDLLWFTASDQLMS